MITESITLTIFGFIILSVIRDVYDRIHFNREIEQNRILILKHKDFRTYSISNLFYGIIIILFEMLKFKSQGAALNYLGLLCVVLLNITAAFKFSNYIAIGEEGIWLDRKIIKWEKIESIRKEDSEYSIIVKNNDHRITFNKFKNEIESRILFADGIRRYNKIDPAKLKI